MRAASGTGRSEPSWIVADVDPNLPQDGIEQTINPGVQGGSNGVPLAHIHTYLVHPRDKQEAQAGGTEVPLKGQLFDLLNEVYRKSDAECDIDIAFNPSGEGVQENAIRALVLQYLTQPNLENGLAIAGALKAVTTNRSGVGMLFLMAGEEDGDHKVVVSRFPADKGILAEEAEKGLNVEFLERVFMKSDRSEAGEETFGPLFVRSGGMIPLLSHQESSSRGSPP